MKKQKFVRQDAHKKVRLGSKWRRPKGLQSKLRLQKAGHGKKVSIGHRSPLATRHVREGKKSVVVSNVQQLKKVDVKKEVVTISKIGLRKKIDLVKEAITKSIVLINVPNPKKFLEETEKKLKVRKKTKADKAAKEEKKGDPEKKEKLDEKVDEDAEKDKEKKEKDKLLTKRV